MASLAYQAFTPASSALPRAPRHRHRIVTVRAAVSKTAAIKVERNPSEAKLKELGVSSWPTWGCPASKFPWYYDSTETCYVLQGRVIVTPDGGEPVEIQKGDMATFPAGMGCTWDVKEAIKKHYSFS